MEEREYLSGEHWAKNYLNDLEALHRPIISQSIRIRYPDLFEVGEGTIIDDFSYFAGHIIIGCGSHLASGISVVGGGRGRVFQLGDYSGIGSGCRILLGSSDFVGGLITVGLPNDRPTTGDVIFGNYTGMGVNSVVMPGQNVPEGVAIGALSFVPGHFPFEPWTIYAGNPIRKIRERDKESVMRQLRDVEG